MDNMGNRRSYDSKNSRNSHRNAGNRQEYGRNDYAQKFVNREGNPQKSRENNSRKVNNKVVNTYGNICNTMQKKFNMTLYKGVKDRETELDRKKGVQNNSSSSARKNSNKNEGSIRRKSNSQSDGNIRRKSSNQNEGSIRRKNSNQNKRFNVIDNKSSLNKDRQNNDRVQYNRNLKNINEKKEKATQLQGYSEEKKITTQYDEEVIEALPKSVFVFITVAVLFIAVLIIVINNKEEVGKKIANITTGTKVEKPINNYDEGLNLDEIQEELDSSQEDYDNLEDSDDGRETILAAIAAAEREENIDTSDNKTAVSTKKPTATKKPATTVGNASTTTTTMAPTPTTKPSEEEEEEIIEEEEEEEEEEEVVEDVELAFIPMSLSGTLYRCSNSYGVFGAESSFIKCSKSYYIESLTSVMVPKKDLNGIWLDVVGTKVNDYIGYKNGVKTQVIKLRLEQNSDASLYADVYAIKGTVINLGATYRKKSQTSTFTSITATEDIVLERVGM